MPRLKLIVEYDGTAFHGWQAQADLRTVQGEIRRCLRELTGSEADPQGASRTDRGVHALGQTVGVDVESRIPIEHFREALNARLPADVRVRAVEEVDVSFDPRRSAHGKHYRYAVAEGVEPGVFMTRFLESVPAAVSLESIREAIRHLEGEHDFASFRASGSGSDASTVRTLDAVTARRDGRIVLLDFWGRSFLYKMVRGLAGTLLEVGRGRWSPVEVEAILGARDRSRAGPTAPARGLCLVKIFYDEEEYSRDLRRAPGFLEFLASSLEHAADERRAPLRARSSD